MSINGKPWNPHKEVCKVLEYGKTTKMANVVKNLCSSENSAYKCKSYSDLIRQERFS